METRSYREPLGVVAAICPFSMFFSFFFSFFYFYFFFLAFRAITVERLANDYAQISLRCT